MHPLFGFLLDVVSWTWVVAQVDYSSESVQAVSDGDVKSLAEDAVSLLGVSDDLGITPRNIEHDWIFSASYLPTHFNV